jgi:hypothetical protein
MHATDFTGEDEFKLCLNHLMYKKNPLFSKKKGVFSDLTNFGGESGFLK